MTLSFSWASKEVKDDRRERKEARAGRFEERLRTFTEASTLE